MIKMTLYATLLGVLVRLFWEFCEMVIKKTK